MRVFRALLAGCLALTQGGCADILWWPGFESKPGIFSYPEQVPAAEIAQQVKCELARFIKDEEDALIKHPHGPHSVSTRFLDPE